MKEKNIRKIKKVNKDGSYTEIEVDWNKLPCATCDRRFHFSCPKPDCWDKEQKYILY